MQGKPVILYDNRLNDGTPTATDTASGYDVLNLRDYRTYTYWKAANATGIKYVTVDCGTPKSADALGIVGHNLNTVGATISVESSPDNSVWTERLAGFTPSNDKALLKLFTSASARYWRLKITGMSAAPFMAILVIGSRFTFERYLKSPFDPDAEKVEAKAVRSKGGHVLGVAIAFYERNIQAEWSRLTPSWIKNTFIPAWTGHLSKCLPFFWAWEPTDHSDEVYYVALPPDASLRMPYDPVRRSLSLDMVGVRE